MTDLYQQNNIWINIEILEKKKTYRLHLLDHRLGRFVNLQILFAKIQRHIHLVLRLPKPRIKIISKWNKLVVLHTNECYKQSLISGLQHRKKKPTDINRDNFAIKTENGHFCI